MAEKRRFFDLWIIEANTVYREVPFDAVADWVQQGRLLEDDMLRPSGTAEWRRLGDFMDFKVYLPKPASGPEPPSAVEPMEPVEMGFTWRRPADLEETEVDMIPLIDVSLVLLIFFMLTAKPADSGGPAIALPGSEHSIVAKPEIDSVWVGMDLEANDPNHTPFYSCGVGQAAPLKGDSHIATRQDLLTHLQILVGGRTDVPLTFKGNRDLNFDDVYRLKAALAQEPFNTEIGVVSNAVSDKKP